MVARAVRRALDAARGLPDPPARARAHCQERREGDAHALDASSRVERRLPGVRRGDRRCPPRQGRAIVSRGPRRDCGPAPRGDGRAAADLGRVARADDRPRRATDQAGRDLAALDRRLHARAARPPAALRDVQLLPRRALRPVRGLGRRACRAGGADAASRPALPRGIRPGDDRRHGVVDRRADAGDPRGARRRAANLPRRGGPPAVRPAACTATCRRHARAGAPAPEVGLLAARLRAARARADPPRALSQAGDRPERRCRADHPRRRLRRGHLEGREEARAHRALRAASARRSATSSRPRASGCSRSSRERTRAHAAGAEPGAARPAAAPRTLDAVHPAARSSGWAASRTSTRRTRTSGSGRASRASAASS